MLRIKTALACQITENYIFKIMKMYKDKKLFRMSEF